MTIKITQKKHNEKEGEVLNHTFVSGELEKLFESSKGVYTELSFGNCDFTQVSPEELLNVKIRSQIFGYSDINFSSGIISKSNQITSHAKTILSNYDCLDIFEKRSLESTDVEYIDSIEEIQERLSNELVTIDLDDEIEGDYLVRFVFNESESDSSPKKLNTYAIELDVFEDWLFDEMKQGKAVYNKERDGLYLENDGLKITLESDKENMTLFLHGEDNQYKGCINLEHSFRFDLVGVKNSVEGEYAALPIELGYHTPHTTNPICCADRDIVVSKTSKPLTGDFTRSRFTKKEGYESYLNFAGASVREASVCAKSVQGRNTDFTHAKFKADFADIEHCDLSNADLSQIVETELYDNRIESNDLVKYAQCDLKSMVISLPEEKDIEWQMDSEIFELNYANVYTPISEKDVFRAYEGNDIFLVYNETQKAFVTNGNVDLNDKAIPVLFSREELESFGLQKNDVDLSNVNEIISDVKTRLKSPTSVEEPKNKNKPTKRPSIR
ncbi:TPA: hypothetical protein ACN35C_004726 [Vibrio parahaemolyticus]